MGLLTRALEKRADAALDDSYWASGRQTGFFSVGGLSHAGTRVTTSTATNVGAFYNGMVIYSSTVAQLPLHVYEQTENEKRKARDHPMYSILHDSPNGKVPSFAWRESMMAHLICQGNAYSEIEWTADRSRVKALWLLQPDRMIEVRYGTRDGQDKGNRYYYYLEPGSAVPTQLAEWQVFHVPGLSYDGLTGLSILGAAKQAIGKTLAMDMYASNFYRQGGVPMGYLQIPPELEQLGTEAIDQLKKGFVAPLSGLSKETRLGTLEDGIKWEQLGLSPEDAQFLATLKEGVIEIARYFNLPPHFLKALDRATFNNIEEMGLEFVMYALGPWLKRIEQWIKLSFFHETQNFAEFDVAGLLRGNITAQYQAFKEGRYGGWMTANNVLDKLNENRLPPEVGDIIWAPANMIPYRLDGTVADGLPPKKEAAAGEKRSEPSGGAQARNRLRSRYLILIRQQMARIVRREVVDVTRKVKKWLGQRDTVDIQQWLEEYYGDDHRAFIENNYRPTVQAYVEDVYAIARDEVDIGNMEDELRAEIEKFTAEYIAWYAERHAQSSLGQLKALIRDATEDVESDLLNRLEEWDETRADKIARDESVRVGEATAAATFTFVGYSMVWNTMGPKPCPYCQNMDGKVIGREGYFVRPGDVLNPDETNETMRVYGPKRHPPLHGGCECGISAIME